MCGDVGLKIQSQASHIAARLHNYITLGTLALQICDVDPILKSLILESVGNELMQG